MNNCTVCGKEITSVGEVESNCCNDCLFELDGDTNLKLTSEYNYVDLDFNKENPSDFGC